MSIAATMNNTGASVRSPQWGVISRIVADDLDSAADQMRCWSTMEYTRLDRRPVGMRGSILALGSVLVGQWGGGCDKMVRSFVPADTVAILVPVAGYGRLGTTDIVPGGIYFGSGGTGHVMYTGHGFESVLIGTSQARWSEFLDACGVDFQLSAGAARMLSAPLGNCRQIGALAGEAARAATHAPEEFSIAARLGAVDEHLLAGIVRALGSGCEPLSLPLHTKVARHRAALRARDYIDAHLDRRLSLPELCREAYTSARALEYGFRELFGITPMAYARCARLARVRRHLRDADGDRLSVTEAATRWGFWHLGQFSKDYKSLFGESPSATRAQARA